MLTEGGGRMLNEWGIAPEADPRCEDCERSLVTRFGEELPPQFCESCQADFRAQYMNADGVIEIG